MIDLNTDKTNLDDSKTSTCESCGEEFGCGVQTGSCWCINIELTEAARDDLKAKFEKCLCPKCLNEVATG